MPLKVKRSGAWVSIPNGKINVATAGAKWVPPKRVYVKSNGVWVDTGYRGAPLALASFFIAAESSTSITVYANSYETPQYIRAAVYDQSGTLINGPVDMIPYYYHYYTFSVSPDTNYIIRAWAVNDGLDSVKSEIKRHTGHAAQGYTAADYGWGPIQSTRPSQIDGTTAHESGQFPGASSVDSAGDQTSWVSGPRTGFAGGVFWEGLVFAGPGGNRLISSIRAFCNYQQEVWLAMQIGGTWKSPYGYVPSNMNMTPIYGVLDNPYLFGVGGGGSGVNPKVFNIEGFGYNLSAMNRFTLAVTNLRPWPLSYRGEMGDVWIDYKDWVQTGSHYVETVAAVGNSSW